MPAASNIVLADSIPANHTFSPAEIDSANALFTEKTLSLTSAGQEGLRLKFSRGNSGRPTDRLEFRLDLPYEQTVDGVTTVYDTARMVTTITIPQTATVTQRANFMALIQALFNHTVIEGYIEDLEPVWG